MHDVAAQDFKYDFDYGCQAQVWDFLGKEAISALEAKSQMKREGV